MRWISRIDQDEKATHGYYVRIYETRKFFSDRKLGGKSKARHAAKAWRDELASFLGLEIKPQPRIPQSGVTGVVHITDIGIDGKARTYWRAIWREGGRSFTKSWSITKLGSAKALREATKFRRTITAIQSDTKIPASDTKIRK